MSVQSSRHDCEVKRVTAALRAPLPPARLHADPAALWACGRHARRISTETKISLVVTTAEVSALVGVLGVLVAFVDWRSVWIVATDALTIDRTTGICAAVAMAAIAGLIRWTRSHPTGAVPK